MKLLLIRLLLKLPVLGKTLVANPARKGAPLRKRFFVLPLQPILRVSKVPSANSARTVQQDNI